MERGRGAERDVVLALGFATWRVMQERGMHRSLDRLVETVLEHPRVGRLLVADPPRSTPIRLARRLVGGAGPPFPASEGRSHYAPGRLRRLDPTTVPGAQRSFKSYDRRLRRAARRAGLEDPVVITNNPLVAGFAPLGWARSVTFYANDDHAVGRPRWSAVFREAQLRVAARGHRVCAVNPLILERIAPTGPSLLAPNGVEPREFAQPGPPPPSVAALSQPLAVYAGVMDERIDADAIAAAAGALGAGSVVLIGPVEDEERVRPLRALPNVRFVGTLDRAGVVAAIAAADVGLLAHRRTPRTESMSPLKLYEYLAAGLPVAATSPIHAVDERVVAADAVGFGEAVERALALGRASEQWRAAFVEDNSWRRRHAALMDFALS